jgi:polyhydroxyalkanoate synthase
MAVKMAGENQLAKGRVEVSDNVAELDAIESNLLAFAGKTDILVPADIAKKIVDIVASKDKEFRIAPGGHMGVIIGSKAQSAVWAESVEWLAKRSSHAKPKTKTKRKPPRKARKKAPAKAPVPAKKVRRRASASKAKG